MLKVTPKADRETNAGHQAYAKEGTNAEPHDQGENSQIEYSGVDAISARSSKGVSGDSIAAAQATSGAIDTINGANAGPIRKSKLDSAPTSSVLNGSAPSSSNPATGDNLKSFPGLGWSLPTPGKQDGYVHCIPDLPTANNLEMTNDPPVKSWKNLVSMPVKTGGPLQFYMPNCADGKLVAKPPVEAVNEGIDMWKGCLVGQFLDKRLPFPVVRSLINRLWGKREMPDISTTENGLFFFRFRDPKARDLVMNAGPWHLAGRPFKLRAWKPGMDMLNIQLSSIPIGVRFYNIPLEYWTSTCLGHIASTVGIPLHLDPLTENQTKLTFVRIGIEVGVDCEFPKSVLLDRGNGSYSTIRIEYPWAPQCCSECKLFGHNLVNCQAKKSPSSGMISTNPGNNRHEAVNGKDIDDEGEGSKIADEPTRSVATPTVTQAATGNSTSSRSIPKVTHAEAGIRLEVEDIRVAIEIDVPPKLYGNTFACLAHSEEEGPSGEEGTLNTDFSDTSPIFDTFRHVKRVDELDFTPVPLSRKKLKKLKKRSPANKQNPVIRGTPHHPNG